jgi:hypothetical protein
MKQKTCIVFSLLLLCWGTLTWAAQELKEAEITEVKNQVVKGIDGTKRPAVLKDKIGEKSVVDTETASLAELTFADSSVTRLGPSSEFSFSSKERMVKLDKGSFLMHTPPGNGGANVDLGGGVTASVTGTTILVAKDAAGGAAFFVMEGSTGKIVNKDGKITEIHPGEVGTMEAGSSEIKVSAVNVDFIRDHAPLFQEFSSVMPGTEGIQAVSDLQASQIQMEMSVLMAPTEAGLSEGHSSALGMMLGYTAAQTNASKNLILAEPDTAAGREESSSPSNVTDARQAGAEVMTASTSSSVDTASGAEAPAGTDTAAGGNSAPDTQPPAPVRTPAQQAAATPI